VPTQTPQPTPSSITESNDSPSRVSKHSKILENEQRYAQKQRELEEAKAEMKLVDEWLQLFWRVNKSLNVLVYGNAHDALCIQVYNKYTGKCYNKVFCTRQAIMDAIEKGDQSLAGAARKKSSISKQNGPPITAAAKSGKSSKLAEALKKYIQSDHLQLLPSGSDGGGDTKNSADLLACSTGSVVASDGLFVLTLRGVATAGSAEELRVLASLRIAPRGRMEVGRRILSRTMTECKKIAETLSRGLDDSFQHLSKENKEAESMVSKTNEMLMQLEAAVKLCEIEEGGSEAGAEEAEGVADSNSGNTK
jgi:hypothetical protein